MKRQGNGDNKESREGGTENGGKFTKRKGHFSIVANSGQPGAAGLLPQPTLQISAPTDKLAGHLA